MLCASDMALEGEWRGETRAVHGRRALFLQESRPATLTGHQNAAQGVLEAHLFAKLSSLLLFKKKVLLELY